MTTECLWDHKVFPSDWFFLEHMWDQHNQMMIEAAEIRALDNWAKHK